MTKFRQKKTLYPTIMRIFDLANSRPQCHPFQKGGAVLSQLVPRPSATCFKKVELFYRTFFQAPVSPVSKRWSAHLAPSLQQTLVLHCKLPSSAFRLLAGFTCWDGGQGRARGFVSKRRRTWRSKGCACGCCS
jgi:hypothetical protein